MIRSTVLLLVTSHVFGDSVLPDSSGAQVTPLDTSNLKSTTDQYKAVADASQQLLDISDTFIGGLKPGKGDALINFLPGTEEWVREAIMDSISVAQVVCATKVEAGTLPTKASDPVAYYAEYNKVMEALGWNMKDEFFADYQAFGTAVSMSEMLIDGIISVVTGISSGGGATVAAAALNALQVMVGMAKKDGSDGSDKSWDFFKLSYMSTDLRTFTVGAGHQDEYGIPQLTTFTNRFQYAGSHGTFLFFFSWDSRNTQYNYRFSSMYLNPRRYKTRSKLVEHLLENIDADTFGIGNEEAREFIKLSAQADMRGNYDFKIDGAPVPGRPMRWTNKVIPSKDDVVPHHAQSSLMLPAPTLQK